MTVSNQEDVPDLELAGLGASYWLDRGVAFKFGKPQAQAAA